MALQAKESELVIQADCSITIGPSAFTLALPLAPAGPVSPLGPTTVSFLQEETLETH